MLPIKLVRLVFSLFQFNRNTETLCFGIEAKQPNKCYVSDSARTSFGSSFSCFKSKLVSKDTLVATFLGSIPASVGTMKSDLRGGR
jgi:hypothetical protein